MYAELTCMSDIEFNCNALVFIFCCLFINFRLSHQEMKMKPTNNIISEYDEVNFKPHTEELTAQVNPAYRTTTLPLKEAGNDNEHIYDKAE